jgi:hypothetical protein
VAVAEEALAKLQNQRWLLPPDYRNKVDLLAKKVDLAKNPPKAPEAGAATTQAK